MRRLDDFATIWTVKVVVLPSSYSDASSCTSWLSEPLLHHRKRRMMQPRMQSNCFLAVFSSSSDLQFVFATFNCRSAGSTPDNDVPMSDDRMRCGTPEHATFTLASFIVMGALRWTTLLLATSLYKRHVNTRRAVRSQTR